MLFLYLVTVLAADTAIAGRTYSVADGWTLHQAVQPGLVERPINASFDDFGRLYVTDVTGTNDSPAEQNRKAPHRVLRLEDTNGDGVFDKRTVFAEKLGFPEGILWHRGSVYVGAPPHIWKLTDTDDDGVADKREE